MAKTLRKPRKKPADFSSRKVISSVIHEEDDCFRLILSCGHIHLAAKTRRARTKYHGPKRRRCHQCKAGIKPQVRLKQK